MVTRYLDAIVKVLPGLPGCDYCAAGEVVEFVTDSDEAGIAAGSQLHVDPDDLVEDVEDAAGVDSPCCDCCLAAAERGELEHVVGGGCPHPACDFCTVGYSSPVVVEVIAP